jgi:uncharacterized protein YndB with AHSA1/START domain
VARNDTVIRVAPERVWEVLEDATAYSRWVVGTVWSGDPDETWPGPRGTFRFDAGWGPLRTRGTTTVLAAEPPRVLVLQVDLPRAGIVNVELNLDRVGEGTHVELREHAVSGIAKRLQTPISDTATFARNAFSLNRLRTLVEQRVGSPAQV